MWEDKKKSIFHTVQKLVQSSMVIGSQGNVSLRFKHYRTGQQLVAITPSGIDYDLLKSNDIVVVDMKGKILEGEIRPSIEAGLHLAIYRIRKNVNAIIHSHSLFATLISVTTKKIPGIIDDQIIYLGSIINVAKRALPGSNELAQNVVKALGKNNAVFMSNHGSLVTGSNVKEALFNCQLLERVAKIYFYSILLGKLKTIPDTEVKEILSLGHTGMKEA